MSSITKSIQNEYVLLMENAFSEKYKYAFRNLELKELRRFILKELMSFPSEMPWALADTLRDDFILD